MNARTIARFAAATATAAMITLGAAQAAHATTHTLSASTAITATSVDNNPWE
jgi:ABC-type sugar transport system substrate-binding protein